MYCGGEQQYLLQWRGKLQLSPVATKSAGASVLSSVVQVQRKQIEVLASTTKMQVQMQCKVGVNTM